MARQRSTGTDDPSGGKGRARLEVGERRAQLLALGLAMFSERPYEQVSVDDIAREAGVSKGLLYHYFPTKRELYIAALKLAASQLVEETVTDAQEAPELRVQKGLEAYLDFVQRHQPAYVALMRGGLGADPQVVEILEDTRSIFVDRILVNLPPEAIVPLMRTALRGWIGFVEATALDWASQQHLDAAELVSLLSGVLFDVVARATGPMDPSGLI